MAKNKKNPMHLNHKSFCGLMLFSITLLIYGTCYLILNGGINFYSVSTSFERVVPQSIAVGILGYIIGSILDKPKIKRRKGVTSAELIEKMVQDAVNGNPVGLNDVPDLDSAALEDTVDSDIAESSKMGGLPSDLNIKVNTEADI